MSGFPATLPVDPAVIMRMNQRLYPVPEEFKTSGQYYEDLYEELFQDFDDWCCESGCGAAKAERRLEKFWGVVCDIRYAAANVIRKHYLSYRRKRKLRTETYFKAVRHNGVNYSSALYCLYKQRYDNCMKNDIDYTLSSACERIIEKINKQRACVLIQRNFRRFKVGLDLYYQRWGEYVTEMEEKERREEMEREEEEIAYVNKWYIGGWEALQEDLRREEEEMDEGMFSLRQEGYFNYD